jgi:phage-related protein
MANKNQVTLTFAGDETQLSKAFDSVGASAKRMDDSVGAASKNVGDSADGFHKAGEAADGTYDKFDALESVGRGTTDTMSGLGAIMKGDILQGSTDLAGGVAALADGFQGALLPAIKAAAQGGIGQAAATVKQTAAAVASKTAQVAVAGATKAWTAAQWLMNAALTANPIGLVVAAIALLVGGLVIAYKKSETFRNIVNGSFGAVKKVAVGIFSWIRDNWVKILGFMTSPFSLAIKPIWKHRDSILSAIKAVPGAIGKFMGSVANIITAPFRAAFNGIKSAWNSTVGGKGFTVPGWVPELGGKGFTIPYFHTGGIVPGGLGSESLAVLRAGERVTAGTGSGGGGGITLQSDGSRAGDLLLQLFKETMRVKDGAAYRVVFGG